MVAMPRSNMESRPRPRRQDRHAANGPRILPRAHLAKIASGPQADTTQSPSPLDTTLCTLMPGPGDHFGFVRILVIAAWLSTISNHTK
jgi:hypothetical protein